MTRQILLVEPDVDALGKLAEALRARGMTVVLADDMSTALSRARAHKPHIVFIATSLPKRRELVDALAHDAHLNDIQRVMLVKAPSAEGLPDGHASYDDVEGLLRLAVGVRLQSNPPENSGELLRGTLEQVPLVDLLQLFSMGRRTGRLKVTTPRGEGELRLVDGNVVDAVYRRLEGEKALYRLLSEREGTVVFTPGASEGQERINKDISEILMEGMRQKDETERLRGELGGAGLFELTGEPLTEPAQPLERLIFDGLSKARTLDDLLDEPPEPDLDVLQALRALVEAKVVRRCDGDSSAPRICTDDQLPMLRVMLGRMAKAGFPGPPRLVVASTPARIQAFAASLSRVASCSAPAEPPPAAPVPHAIGTLRFGDGVDLALIGLPVVDAFAPLWSLTLPGASALLRLDESISPALDASTRAFEITMLVAPSVLSGFDETSAESVAALLRAVIEGGAPG